MISKGFLRQAPRADPGPGAAAGAARGRRHADPRPGAELPADAGRRVAGAGARPGRRSAWRPPPSWPTPGWRGRSTAGRCELPLAAADGEVRAARPLSSEGAASAWPARRRPCGWCPGWTSTPLDAGCCGMAGSFGFEKEHYDLSVAIANLALLPALEAPPPTRSWSPRARRAGTRSRTWPAAGRCTRWRCWRSRLRSRGQVRGLSLRTWRQRHFFPPGFSRLPCLPPAFSRWYTQALRPACQPASAPCSWPSGIS